MSCKTKVWLVKSKADHHINALWDLHSLERLYQKGNLYIRPDCYWCPPHLTWARWARGLKHNKCAVSMLNACPAAIIFITREHHYTKISDTSSPRISRKRSFPVPCCYCAQEIMEPKNSFPLICIKFHLICVFFNCTWFSTSSAILWLFIWLTYTKLKHCLSSFICHLVVVAHVFLLRPFPRLKDFESTFEMAASSTKKQKIESVLRTLEKWSFCEDHFSQWNDYDQITPLKCKICSERFTWVHLVTNICSSIFEAFCLFSSLCLHELKYFSFRLSILPFWFLLPC